MPDTENQVAQVEQTNQAEQPAMIDVENVDQFAHYVAVWHKNRVARVRGMLSIPFGTEVSVTEHDGSVSTVKLKGDGMKGFQAAVLAILSEIQELPFAVSEEPVPEAANTTTVSANDDIAAPGN